MNIRRVDGVVLVVGGLAVARGEDCSNVGLPNGLLLGINLNLPPSPIEVMIIYNLLFSLERDYSFTMNNKIVCNIHIHYFLLLNKLQ